ncbi:MAG: TonB-dependent receptor plug domain-containing protein [Saprospiraceae bacterium]|nr:TonB-dependent receptor plug domain-containing protein [Saprospiraceae bacterium]
MKSYITIATMALLLFSANAWCQQQITGSVLDAQTNNPIEGATLSYGDNMGTITDNTGKFNIPCSASLDLKVSFIGYKSLEKKVTCGSEIILMLTPVSTELEAVEITAISNPNKSQLEQPLSIVQLKKTEINRGTGIYMDDAINTNIPGVYMSRRTQSAGQQINIRGYGNGIGFRGASNNFDSQGLKMYLNGIPITDAEGITAMDDIDFGSVENVEILKGPSGTLYGLAISGVVNLQTQKAENNKITIGQDVMAGSYGLLRTTTRLAIGGERSSLLVNYGHQKFDGFMPHTETHKDFINLMGDFDLNDKQKLTTYLGYSDSYNQRNGELTIEQYANLDYTGNAKYIANNAHSAMKTFRAGVGHTYTFCKQLSNTTSFFGSAIALDNSSAGGWTDKYPVNVGLRSTFDTQFDLGGSITLSGITGIEMQRMNAHSVSYGMGADSTDLSGYNVITSTRSNQALTSSTYSYFTQWTLKLPLGISVNAGVGISNMSVSLEDRLWGLTNNFPGNKVLPIYEASYKSLVSPSFAINKTINKTASVYAAYSTGYKTPVSSNILISYTGEVNTGLIPEYGTQIELGTKGSFMNNRLFYTLAVFNAKFQDKFTTETVQDPSNTATLYSYLVNGGDLNNKGLELLVRYNAIDAETGFIQLVRPFANLTYSDFKYENFQYEKIGKDISNMDSTIVEDYSGNAVAGVSPVVFNAGIDIHTKPGLYGNITYNYRSSMYYTSDGLNETEPFSLLNAKLGFMRSIKGFTFDAFVGANNLTGTQYYNMVFVNQLPDAYIPAPNEINFFGGLNLKYTF